MYPVHDVDALLLLAISLSAKRRPAELVAVIAAYDLIPGAAFSEEKLAVAFQRLSVCGLISESANGFELSPEAQQSITGQPKKIDTPERITRIKANLSAYSPKGEHAPVIVTTEQLLSASHAHRASKNQSTKNLFVPRPKPDIDSKRPGRRKPFPARRH
ncbi:MAG: hypothetical protein A2342_05745 [Gallionellales bacterium RIFOXYB12_FULL_54_9]|nr:MAG: hypothetical protein A2342_05745 [Gallionellales bacterium RIFOXYB12_FULL_54_9]